MFSTELSIRKQKERSQKEDTKEGQPKQVLFAYVAAHHHIQVLPKSALNATCLTIMKQGGIFLAIIQN